MSKWMFLLVGDLREVLHELMPKVESIDRSEWLDSIDKFEKAMPPCATSRTCLTAGKSLRGSRDQRSLARDARRRHYSCDGRRPTPDVGGAILQARERRASLITSGGLGTMGFALPAAIGAKVARPEAEKFGSWSATVGSR